MKTFWIGAVVMILLNSCQKDAVEPVVSNKPLESEVAKPAIQQKGFNITFEFPAQVAVTRVKQNKLTIVYTEKVNLLVDPTEYVRSWGLHLTESFTTAALANFDYTTITQYGDKTFNWVDDNLNNVIIKAKTDTTINNTAFKKVVIERDFTFVKEYDNNQLATNAQAALLLRKNDMINYTSFYYSDKKDAVPVAATAKVIYTAASN